MRVIERIHACGHKNVLSTHKSTIEITKDKNVSKKGNCIIGVNASKACNDLSVELKAQIKHGDRVRVILKAGKTQDSFFGFGNKKLLLLDRDDMVFRKSSFICDRTVLIKCSKSSVDINRDLIRALQNPNKELSIVFIIDD